MLLLKSTSYVPVERWITPVAPLPRTRLPAELKTAHFAVAACAMLGMISMAASAHITIAARRRAAPVPTLMCLPPRRPKGVYAAPLCGGLRDRASVSPGGPSPPSPLLRSEDAGIE